MATKYSLPSSPGHLLRRAQQFAHDLYAKQVGARGPTQRQFAVLHTVAENPGLSQTDLVRRTGIDRSTLADMISRLIKKGLLARERTKTDARANAVRITAAGRSMLNAAKGNVVKAENAVMTLLPASQRSQFMKSLSAFAEALDAMEARSSGTKRRATKKKKATKRKAVKRKTAKKTTKRKTAKRKVAKRKVAKRKVAKRKVAKKKTAKRKTAKKTTKRKTAKRKVAKRKVAKKKTTKRKVAKRKVAKRKVAKKKR